MNKEIIMTMEKEEWNDLLKHVFEHKKNDVKVDGFRKGQVPYDVYVKKFGVESLYMDAVDHAIPTLYDKLIEENKDLVNKIACRPSVDIKSVTSDKLEVKFTIIFKPEVKLGKYKDLKIKKEEATVTEEEVNHELDHLRERYAELKEKTGKVEEGDIANINFEGFKGGKAFDGGKGENYDLTIGSHSFIPGFEEAIVGMEINEEKDIDLTFPENYHSEELKGQKVTFKVKVNSIKEKILPEYNEDFFKDLNMEGVNSLETLKAEVEAHIKGHKLADIEDKYFEECLSKVSDNAKVEVPNEMIEEETDRMVNDFDNRLKMQGMNIDTYMKMLNVDLNTFKENFKPEAEKRVKYRLVLEAVVKEENITVEDKELDDYTKEMASKYQISEEDLLKEIGGKDFLKYDLEVRKALEIVTK